MSKICLILCLYLPGPEPDITAIVQVPPSDPVHPGDSVTLQCSVLSDSEKKTCLEDHSVYWFRAGSDKSHPSLIYAHRNSTDYCENSHEAHSLQKCVYNFSKIISSSDSGTYYCAVATCGEIIFGNGTKLDIEGKCGTFLYNGKISILCVSLNMWDLQKANVVLFLLCAALTISLILLSFCSLCTEISRFRDEDSLAYSAPAFTKKKAGKAERRKTKTTEGETVYTDVRAFEIDE
uniref:Ig-like domain-containing protein n=1 Tax=Lates calcarifer TaxID=8187 RepID=A0A4W6FCT5_LATCA